MKITRLVLSGYKRLLLNNIRVLTLNPESIYQLILGTNGSGKSSVLHELSPLPAQSANYAKGGYKEIEVTQGGDQYVLTSVFKSGNKHSFVKNGEEHNPGGTGAVQKELVEQAFGLTQDLHELLIGDTHFTNLSPSKRREWITRLCHIDFSYAMSVHNKLKSATRDAQGALKHTKQRIGSETQRLQAMGDLNALEQRYQTLHQELEVLFTERAAGAMSVDTGEDQLRRLMSELEELTQTLVTQTPEMPEGFRFDSLLEIDEQLNTLKTDVQVKQSLRSRIATEHDELSKLLEGFEEAGVENLEAVKQQDTELKQQRYQTQRRIETWRELSVDPIDAQRSYFEAAASVMGVLKSLPANPDRYFTKDQIRRTREELPALELAQERERNRLAHLESQLEHLNKLQHQDCPNCQHRWIPGKSEQNVKRLNTAIDKAQAQCALTQAQVQKGRTYLQEAEEYSQQFYGFRQLTQTYPKLKDLWEALSGDERLAQDPPALVGVVKNFGKDLEYHVEVHGLSERIEKLSKLLDNPTEGQQLNGVTQRLEALNKQIDTITDELEIVQQQTRTLGRYRQNVLAYLEKVEALENRLEELDSLKNDLTEAYRNHHIGKAIEVNQLELAHVYQTRSEKHTLEGVLNDLNADAQTLEEDHRLLGLLSDALSPVDGLIAEQLTGFIKSFVGHVNQVIAQIWTYDLRVLPCGLDSGDLDYKFPLYVKHDGSDNVAPDIAKGSEAQVEVVNLAFRLVTMVYLGLSEYPVYLDEAGRSFDEQHRTNLMQFIKQLVDTGNYTQLFIVSHYAAQFGVFTNSDILVLDDSNVTIPKQHNVHATLA